MYIHNENILDYIYNDTENISSAKELLIIIYKNLLINNVITQRNIDILNAWISYF